MTAAFVVTPWLPRALIWDYVDGAAITYVLVAMWLLLGAPARSRSLVRPVAAGVVIVLAANCNAFVVVIVAAFFASWLLFGFARTEISRRVRVVCAVAAGAITTQILLSALMALRYPSMGFTYFTKNSDVLPTLLKTGDAYFVGLGTLLDNRPYVWVPIFAAAAMLALAIVAPRLHLPRDRRRFVMVGAGFVVASWLCFAGFHAAGQGVLSLFFYVDYFVPALVLVAIAMIGEVFRRVPKVWSDAATGVLVVGFVGLYSLQRWGSPASWTIDAPMFIVGVATVIGMVFIVRMPRVSLVTTLVALVIVPLAFVTTPISLAQYSSVVSGNTATAEHDLYQNAVEFEDGVLAAVPTDRSVGFWYGQKLDLNSVQSTFLWGFSRIFDSTNAMPHVDQNLVARANTYDYLVLLANTSGQVDAGAQALCNAGVGLHLVERRVVRRPVNGLAYAVFSRSTDPACPVGTPAR